MLTLLIAATLAGGCGATYGTGYGYAPAYNYGARVSYGAVYQQPYQPPAYQQPYQAPYDYKAVVGEYLREEYAAKEKEQAQADIRAKLDRLELLLAAPKQAPVALPPPVQAPPPVYQPVQLPTKATPQQAPYAPPPFAQAPTPQYPLGYPQPQAQQPFAAPTPPPLRQAGPAGGGGDQAVAQILGNRCADCHKAPASRGAGIVLLDAGGGLAPMTAPLMLAIQEDVKTGHMPKGGPQLPDEELAVIAGWVGDHAPEVAAFLAQGLGR